MTPPSSTSARPASTPRESSPGGWSSTLSDTELALRWQSLGRDHAEILVLTHAKPDGDAIGSTLAAARTLEKLGARPSIAYIDPFPRWAKELLGSTPFKVHPAGATAEPSPAPSTPLIVDTGTWSQLAESRALIERSPNRAEAMLVDHHARGDAEVAPHRLIRTTAASCTEILAGVCAAALGVEQRRLPLDIAEPLYLGLATDTGWFRYSSVTAHTLRTAADLIEADVDHTRLYALIEQQDVIGRWKLVGRALQSTTTHHLRDGSGSVAILTITPADLAWSGADRNDTGGISDMLLSVRDIKAAATLIEQDGPGDKRIIKISTRSKPGPDAIDVNAAMATLGGGGHVRAAGAKFDGSLEDARRAVIEALGAEP